MMGFHQPALTPNAYSTTRKAPMTSNCFILALAALASAILLSGCAGGSAIEDGVPQAALTAQDGPERFPAPAVPGSSADSTALVSENAGETGTVAGAPAGETQAVSVDAPQSNTADAPQADTIGAPDSSSAGLADFQPVETPAVTAPPRTALSTGVPRNTGRFPRLNDEPTPSLNMITDEEKAGLEDKMRALKADHQAGRISASAYRARLLYLQNLARSHSRDTLSRIEGQ
jgi:hypothetical protein